MKRENKSSNTVKKNKDSAHDKIDKFMNLTSTKIKVIGVGGGGGNAINYMISKKVPGVSFAVINTDAQHLKQSKAEKKVCIGKTLTKGFGCGMDPEVGQKAAQENLDLIKDVVKGADIIFITGGEGGGTMTGAGPVIAKVARDLGILSIGVVTKPFSFEGKKRAEVAIKGIGNLKKELDTLIIIPNDKIISNSKKDTSIEEAFAKSNQLLLEAVSGISDLITTPGVINIDLSDVKTVIRNSGMALIGVGKAMDKEKRADLAAAQAVYSPLLDTTIKSARRVLYSIAGNNRNDLKMSDIKKVGDIIKDEINPDAYLKFGTVIDSTLKKGEIKVTVVATNFDPSYEEEIIFKISEDVLFSDQEKSKNRSKKPKKISKKNPDIYHNDNLDLDSQPYEVNKIEKVNESSWDKFKSKIKKIWHEEEEENHKDKPKVSIPSPKIMNDKKEKRNNRKKNNEKLDQLPNFFDN